MNRLFFCILLSVLGSLLAAATWTGTVSTSWSNASNWNPASVPTSAIDVTVPNVTNKPVINATANCRNLTIQTGSSVTLNSSYNLTVSGIMAVNGALNMSSTGDLYATGNFFWESGSTASITNSSATIIVSGNMQFHASSNVQIASGTIQFTGSVATTDLANYSTLTQISSLYVSKSAGTSFSIRTGSQPFTVNGHISNEISSTFYNYFTGNITLKGNINDLNSDPAYGIKWNNGTLIMDGTGPSIGVRSTTCYLKNLTFSQSGTAQLTWPLTLKGKLRIESGVFYPQAHNITIAGDWENIVGPAAFTEGTTARVIFNGTSHQLCNYSETFNILEVNSGAAFRINSSTAVVTCAQYDWTAGGIDVLAGTFTANDLADSGIFGSYWVNPGGVINLTNNDSWVDLNGSMTFTNGGTINVYGGTGTSDWSYGGNASLTMNGPGILDFKNVGINIYDSITYTLNCSINDWDAEIRTVGSFTCNRSSFAPEQGWLVMYGSTDATLTMNSGSLCELRINKIATREEETTPMPAFITDARTGISREVTRANTVNLATNVSCTGEVSIDYGTLNLQSYQFNCCIALIYSTLKMNNASAKFFSNGDIYWQSNSIADITLGTLETTAAWQAVGNALVILPVAVETRLVGTGSTNISITTPNMQFGNLVVGSASAGAGYTMNASSANDLLVAGNLTITAGNELDMSSRNLTVIGALNLNGKLDIHASTVTVHGKPVFATTSNLSVTDGNFTFDDSSNPRDTYMRGILNLTNSTLDAVNNALRFETTSTNTITSSSFIYCDGIFATVSGNFQPVGSTVVITSNPGSGWFNMNVSNGNWLPNLVIDTNTGVILASNLIIKGDLTIQAGTLDVSTSNYSITISGNWIHQGGTFYPRTGRVIFNGTTAQYCNYTETFNILEVNNAYDLFYVNSSTAVVTCAQYDWTAGGVYVSEGTFTANDLADSGIYGIVTARNGATINLTNNDSYVDLNGTMGISGNSTVNIYGGTTSSDWSYGGNAALNMNSGTLDFKNRGIRIYNSPSYTFTSNISGGLIRTVGGLEVNRSGFEPVGGLLELYGSTDASLIMSFGNLYGLYINKGVSRDEEILSQESLRTREKDGSILELTRSNTVNLGSNINVSGDLVIQSGVLNASMLSINVGGNWYNSVGDSGFLEGQSTVVFNGDSIQYIYSTERFWNLTLAKTGVPTVLQQANGVDAYVANDMNLVNGYYLAGFPSNNYVKNLYIQSLAGFITSYDLFVSGNMYDYNTTYEGTEGFCPQGVLTFNGTGNQIVSRSGPEIRVNIMTIDKPAGTRCYFDKPVKLNYSLNIYGGIWQDMANNFIHQVGANLNVWPNGAIANDTNNTFTFVGNEHQYIAYEGTGGFTNITINKIASVRTTDLAAASDSVTVNRSVDVTLVGNLILANSGNLTIENGNLHSSGWDITCNGNFSVNSSTAAAYIEAGSILRMATSKNLNVNAGLLNLTGSATEPVAITSISGFYNFNVESGATLSAIYTTFEKMTASGVNVKAGALVNTTDPFKNCTFQNGAAGGTLLTLNSNQTLNIYNAAFPTNTWSGTNNVMKTMNQGTVNFNLATGAFSGAAFESDTYNRINWLGGNPDLRITSIAWPNNNPYICDAITATVYVQNNSTTNITTPFRVDLYKNRSTPPPAGLMGDSFMTLPSLAAGAITSVTFTNISTDVPGIWTSWFQVDANGLIAESNESNNVWTPANSTTWRSLPIVSSLQAQRSGANVQLNWSYPISVYRFKIYKDTNPNGSFSTLAGTSTTPSFSQAFSGTKWFYRVRAERLLP